MNTKCIICDSIDDIHISTCCELPYCSNHTLVDPNKCAFCLPKPNLVKKRCDLCDKVKIVKKCKCNYDICLSCTQIYNECIYCKLTPQRNKAQNMQLVSISLVFLLAVTIPITIGFILIDNIPAGISFIIISFALLVVDILALIISINTQSKYKKTILYYKSNHMTTII